MSDLEDLLVLRDLSFMLLSFSGFLRFAETSSIKLRDLKFCDGYLEVNICSSKTDQLRKGNKVLIAMSNKITCTVSMLQKFLKKANLSNPDEYIFRPFVKSKLGGCLIKTNKKLSYTRVRECVLKRLQSVPSAKGLKLGLHSFRSGGATAAANSGVNERCWEPHGRWPSGNSKNRHVEDSLQDILMISKYFGI